MQDQQEIDQMKEYLKKNVAGILEKMTLDLLINKPERVVPFMQKWLKEKGPEIQKEYSRKMKNRPVGVETSESEDDDDDEVFELPQKQLENRNKRKSVSAEVYGIYNPKGNFKPTVIPKEENEKQKIRDLIKNIFMFKHLDEKDFNIVIDAMEMKKFEPNDMVITQGDDGNELYVVYKGTLKCYKTMADGSEKFLKEYQPEEVFGELALLYNAPRAANIQAVESSQLYSLNREVFNHIVKESAIQNREKYEQFLSQVEVLESLDNYERQKLCDCLEILNHKEGDVVIKEGHTGKTFYLIIEGKAKAMKLNPNTGEEEEVMKYEEKMYFGELALMKDQPRQASIYATEDLKVARIDRNSFKRILGPLEGILQRNAEKYKKFVTNNQISN